MSHSILSRRSFLKAIGVTTLAATAGTISLPQEVDIATAQCGCPPCTYMICFLIGRVCMASGTGGNGRCTWHEVYACYDIHTGQYCGALVINTGQTCPGPC